MPWFGHKLSLLCYLWFLIWYHNLWFLFLGLLYLCYPPITSFALVSNMKIPRFDLIIYNSCNWSDLSYLISPGKIIFSRALTCSSAVCLYFCRVPTSCSLVALDGFTLGTYDCTKLGSPEWSTVVFLVLYSFVLYYFMLYSFLLYYFVLYSFVLISMLFLLSPLKICCNTLKCVITLSCSSPIPINSPSLSFWVWRNLSCSSIVSCVPLSLVSFIAYVILSVSAYSNGWSSSGLLGLGRFCTCGLANQSLGSFLFPAPVLHH